MKKTILSTGKFTGLNFQKISWMLGSNTLECLYQVLWDSSRITCELHDFTSHFTTSKEEPTLAIRYNGSSTELMCLFSEFVEQGFSVPPVNLNYLLCDHFCQANGKSFNPASLKTFKTRGGSEKVDQFIRFVVHRIANSKSA